MFSQHSQMAGIPLLRCIDTKHCWESPHENRAFQVAWQVDWEGFVGVVVVVGMVNNPRENIIIIVITSTVKETQEQETGHTTHCTINCKMSIYLSRVANDGNVFSPV